MNHRCTSPLTRLGLAVCLALGGCSSSSSGGFGGFGGTGGGGGMEGAETAQLRVAHFAPEVPSAGATDIDFNIVDEGSFNSIGFGQVTQYAVLRTGIHSVTAREPGARGEPSASVTPELSVDEQYTILGYRHSREAGAMGLLLFEESVSGLAVNNGRLLIGHGADDSSWPALDVVDADTDEVLAADLLFGSLTEPIDLVAGEHRFGLYVASSLPRVERGRFRVNVEMGEVVILIVVDNDTVDASVDAAMYSIGPNTTGSVSALPRE